MWNKLKKLFNHDRYQMISVIAAMGFIGLLYGCETTAPSILLPGTKVTARELQAELELLTAKIDNSLADIEHKDKLKKFIYEQSLIVASSGTINPLALLTSLGTILGSGAAIDNIRKRKVIKKLEE